MRILLIEDSVELAELIVTVLSANGYTVETAVDELQGSTLAQRHAPDIVLVDVQRPCIDGCESLRHLRQQSTLGWCPIIAMATLETRSDRDRLLRAGFSGCIPKPIRFHELSKQVAEHFHRTGIPGSCGESRPTPPKS